jgi:hypothetical protein
MSDSAFPSTARSARRAVCIHPSCTSLPASYPRSKSRGAVRVYTSVQAAIAALPQGPPLRSELFCLGPSSLNRPHPSHSSAHPDFAARRLIRDAFAVPIGPRRPTSGSGLSLSVPSLHVVLKDPGEPIGCSCPAPSPTASAFTLEGRVRRLPTLPSNPFHEGRNDFGASCFTFATTCTVARLPDGSNPQWADGDFYARAFDGSVALPAAGYDYGGGWAPPPTGLAPAGTSSLSDSAFAHVPLVKPAPGILSGSLALPLSFVHRAPSFNSRSESGRMGCRCTTMRRVPSSTPVALAPVWVMLSQSIITYSATCVPLLGTPQFRRRAVYMRCLRCAGAPRRPRSGSVLSLTILSQHVAFYDSGKFDGCTYPVPSPSALAFVKA